jgi:hypothetical protein
MLLKEFSDRHIRPQFRQDLVKAVGVGIGRIAPRERSILHIPSRSLKRQR